MRQFPPSLTDPIYSIFNNKHRNQKNCNNKFLHECLRASCIQTSGSTAFFADMEIIDIIAIGSIHVKLLNIGYYSLRVLNLFISSDMLNDETTKFLGGRSLCIE